MKDIKIRPLRADEIECRVSQVSEKGVQLLLYKDARCDKRILDETFGVMGWADTYKEIKGNLFCAILLRDDDETWVQKEDCGIESFADKEKGEASDAFKRAAFNIGIGRELYTKIFIFVKTPTQKNQVGKYELVDRYAKWHVSDIYTNNDTEKIEYLQIADKDNKVVFTYGKKPLPKKEVRPETTAPQVQVVSKEQLDELMRVANGRGDLVVRVAQDNGYDNPRKIKLEDFSKIKTAIEAEILM